MLKDVFKVGALVALLVAGVSLSAGWAQTPGAIKLVAEVPFEFHVAGKLMPPGKYEVKGQSDIVVSLTGEEGSVFAITREVGAKGNSDSTPPKLVFHGYGDEKYFLTEVWTGRAVGRQLRMSEVERAFALTYGHKIRLASVRLQARPVEVSRRRSLGWLEHGEELLGVRELNSRQVLPGTKGWSGQHSSTDAGRSNGTHVNLFRPRPPAGLSRLPGEPAGIWGPTRTARGR